MSDRTPIAQQFACNLRQAEAAARAVFANAASLDAVVAQTRATISESRRLMDQADALLQATQKPGHD